jgi:rubrerythrin
MATVTAQDFIKETVSVLGSLYEDGFVVSELLPKFDALLSRVRQEAVAEELNNRRSDLAKIAEALEAEHRTMKGAVNRTMAEDMIRAESERLKYLMQDERVKRARREALKEMDEAWIAGHTGKDYTLSRVDKLRAEYNQP